MVLHDRQQLVIALVALVMGAAFVLGQYLPVRSRAVAVEQARLQQSLAIARGVADTRQLPVLQERLTAIQAAIEEYESGIIADRDLGSFLTRIADLMSRHNLANPVVAPTEEVLADALTCIPVHMQCTGRFQDLFQFYCDLAALDRFIRIEQVRLINDETLAGAVTMTTRAVVFYHSPAGAVTK